MKISQDTAVSMPIKNMIGIIAGVVMGVFAYTEVTARLTSLRNVKRVIATLIYLKKSNKNLQTKNNLCY
jgi:hypothetical protein